MQTKKKTSCIARYSGAGEMRISKATKQYNGLPRFNAKFIIQVLLERTVFLGNVELWRLPPTKW